MDRSEAGESAPAPKKARMEDPTEPSQDPKEASTDCSSSAERWWCEECQDEADPSCSEDHSSALTDPVTARAALSARVFRAKADVKEAEKALKKAKLPLVSLRNTMDRLQDAVDARCDRLHISYEGNWDEYEHGILSGEAPVALVNTKPLPAEQRAQLCAAFINQELALAGREPEDWILSGWCDLNNDMVAEFFPLQGQGVDLKPGAVLYREGSLDIYLRRCGPKDYPEGARLLGYVLPDGLKAMKVEVGWCDGHCEKKCIFCCDEGTSITPYKVEFREKDSTATGRRLPAKKIREAKVVVSSGSDSS